jgi:hypothetical protein
MNDSSVALQSNMKTLQILNPAEFSTDIGVIDKDYLPGWPWVLRFVFRLRFLFCL